MPLESKAMPTNVSPTASAPPGGAAPMGERVARGVVWLMIVTILLKIISFISQIALTKLLMPDDFGLVALAFAINALANLVCQAGILEVLIQRHRRFSLWGGIAVEMTSAL